MNTERKRGRPPVYATKAERDAAHAAAKREARKRKREEKERRRLSRMPRFEPTGALALRIQLHRAIDEHQPESVIAGLYEQVVRAEEMEAYDRDTAREQERDRKRNAVPVGDLNRGAGMKRGQFLTDAPPGGGLILTEQDLGASVVEVSDAQQAPGRGRVTPEGVGIHDHEDIDFKDQPVESESQWADKHFPKSKLHCYAKFGGKPCLFEVVGILPQDHDKARDSWRFHCYYHSPIHDFRGHEKGSFS